MKKSSRILSVILAMLMVVSMLPVTAFADTTETFVAKIGDVNYPSFDAAYKAAQTGDTIVLLADVTRTEKLRIEKEITIDGGNNIITVDEEKDWFSKSGKLQIKSYYPWVLVDADNVTIKNVTFNSKGIAGAIKVGDTKAVNNIIFENVTVDGAKAEAITVTNKSNITLKKYYSVVNSTYSSIDVKTGSIAKAEPGTVFDIANWRGSASPATSDLKGAVDTEGNPYFVAHDSTTYYRLSSLLAKSSVSDVTLLTDITLTKDFTINSKLNLNGNNLIVENNLTLSKTTVTGEGSIILVNEISTVTAAANLNVITLLDDYYVVYNEETGVYSVKAVALPEVVITDIKETLTDADPDLTFALNFAITDIGKLSEEYLEKLFNIYGSHYVDYVLTIKNLTEADVTFNANGNVDGYLAGQYDEWSENWVSVPFEDVTMKDGESLYIMEYAAKLMGQSGLRYTLAEVAEIVQNFDCGVYFTPEFIVANPYAEITLELKVFTEDAEGNKIDDISVAKNEFVFGNAAIVVDGKITQVFTTVSGALEAAKAGEKVILLRDTSDKYVIVTPGVTLDLVGKDLTADYVVAFKNAYIIDSANVVTTTAASGLLKVAADKISMEEIKDNYMPIWNGSGYEFLVVNETNSNNKNQFLDTSEVGTFEYTTRPTFNATINKGYFGNGAADNNIKYYVRIAWTSGDGTPVVQDFECSEELLAIVYSSGGARSIKLTCTTSGQLVNLTVTTVIKSSTIGVEYTNAPMKVTF